MRKREREYERSERRRFRKKKERERGSVVKDNRSDRRFWLRGKKNGIKRQK